MLSSLIVIFTILILSIFIHQSVSIEQQNPNNSTSALNNKGRSLEKMGKYEQAITYYDKALAIDSNYVKALNNKGTILGRLGKNQEAITYYDKALALNSTETNALYNKGVTLGGSVNLAINL